MEKSFLPETRLGKWSVGLTLLFILIILTFFAFMLFGQVTFDNGNWWDITVGVAVPIEIIAFILSVITFKRKERSVSVKLSIIIGICVILFLLTHSIYIRD